MGAAGHIGSTRDFRSLADDTEAHEFVHDALPWVYEAGNPFFDWFFGESETALSVLAKWMRRSSSEVHIGRATLITGPRPMGGFIAMGGEDLANCRRADALAALGWAGAGGRSAIVERVAASQRSLAPVDRDDYYLSKIGLLPQYRHLGLGAELLERYLSLGWAEGFERFRLDVHAANTSAIQLYRSYGFEPLQGTGVGHGDLSYVGMVLRRG